MKIKILVIGLFLILSGCQINNAEIPVTDETKPTNTPPIKEEVVPSDKKEQQKEEPIYSSWKATLKGYATVTEQPEGFCTENCLMFRYVSFNFTENNSQELKEFMGLSEGNTFISQQKIGLGCLAEGRIWRWNDSDKFGMKQYTLDNPSSTKLLTSSPENPVTIEITKDSLSAGRGAPDCYSHFTGIELIQ